MTKQELVFNVSQRTGVNQDVVEKVINMANDEIKHHLSGGKKIYLRGFGTFTPKVRKAKIGRNISRGTQVLIPEHRVPYFKPCDDFKRVVR